MNDLEEEAIGPGADLAISLTGVLIALLVGSFFFWDKLAVSRDQFKEMLRIEQSDLEAAAADLTTVRVVLAETETQLQEEKGRSSRLVKELSEVHRQFEDLSLLVESQDDAINNSARLKIENADMAQEILDLEKLVDYLKAELEIATNELDRVRTRSVNTEQAAIDDLKRKIDHLERENLSDQPPFININDAWQQLFEIGSATLDPEFEFLLETQIASEIAVLAKDYDAQVIEVVGHTDEVPISGNQINHIDSKLLAVLNNNANLNDIIPRSNMDLGMARAVAVALVLGSDSKLGALTIRPMSAGQSTLPNDQIAPYTVVPISPDAERRRIEIRVRRRSEAQTFR